MSRVAKLARFLLKFAGMNSLGCFLLTLSLSAFAATERPPLFLAVGEQRALTVSGLARYSVGSALVRVHRQGETLLLKGAAPGSTDLWVWKSDGESEIRRVQVQKTAHALWPAPWITSLQALDGIERLEVIPTAQGIAVRGEIRSLAESRALARALAAAPGGSGAVSDETELAPEFAAERRSALQTWLERKDSSPPGSVLAISESGGKLRIHGSVRTPRDRETLLRSARKLLPTLEIALESLPDEAPTIAFRVQILEIRRNLARDLGLKWPEATSGLSLTPQSATWWPQAALELKHLETRGSAHVLSSPELVVRAPGEAELFSGGELPIKLQNRFASTLTWKNFGLSLKLKVAQVAGTRVRFEIFSEVSSLDRTLAVEEVPGLQANRLKTEVDATFGEPLLLTGLIKQNDSSTQQGLPLLNRIPIVGLLFGSDTARDERSELVAVVLPLVRPARAPTAVLTRFTPRGPLVPPRDWIEPETERRLRASIEFPWNVPWREEESPDADWEN